MVGTIRYVCDTPLLAQVGTGGSLLWLPHPSPRQGPTPTPELQRIDREVEYLKRCARESKDNVKIVELLGNEKPKLKN